MGYGQFIHDTHFVFSPDDTDKSYKETNEPDLIVEIDPLTHRDMFSRTLLLLSVTELIEEGFPLPCQSINASGQ